MYNNIFRYSPLIRHSFIKASGNFRRGDIMSRRSNTWVKVILKLWTLMWTGPYPYLVSYFVRSRSRPVVSCCGQPWMWWAIFAPLNLLRGGQLRNRKWDRNFHRTWYCSFYVLYKRNYGHNSVKMLHYGVSRPFSTPEGIMKSQLRNRK